jgi:hypothetical protein
MLIDITSVLIRVPICIWQQNKLQASSFNDLHRLFRARCLTPGVLPRAPAGIGNMSVRIYPPVRSLRAYHVLLGSDLLRSSRSKASGGTATRQVNDHQRAQGNFSVADASDITVS